MSRRNGLLVLIWTLVLAPPAWAQAETRPRLNTAVAFTFQDPEDVNPSARAVPDVGFALAVNGRITKHVAAVGELNLTDHARAVLWGVRAQTTVRHSQGRDHIDVVFFGQMLTGSQVSGVMPSHRALQPGGGFDVRINDWITVRCEADYIKLPTGAGDRSTSQLLLGVVFPR